MLPLFVDDDVVRSVVSGSQISTGISNENSEPTCTLLVTCIDPSIASDKLLQIAKPSPVPPNLRDTDASVCLYLLNIYSICSSGIPIPVSLTENFNTCFCCGCCCCCPNSSFSSSTTLLFCCVCFVVVGTTKCCNDNAISPPVGVNLIAFDNKFNNICRIRLGSPITKPPNIDGSIYFTRRNPLLEATAVVVSIQPSHTKHGSNGIRSISIFPASNFVKSNTSLITLIKDVVDDCKCLTTSNCSSHNTVLINKSINPIT